MDKAYKKIDINRIPGNRHSPNQENQMDENRIKILLKAALKLLIINEDYIDTMVFYDEANCDVTCLINDIEIELKIDKPEE